MNPSPHARSEALLRRQRLARALRVLVSGFTLLALGLLLPSAPKATPPGQSMSYAACARNADGTLSPLPPASRAAYIIIHAAFDRANITIDGEPYRQRCRAGHIVDATAEHEIIVRPTSQDRAPKRYKVRLRPRESVIYMVDLSGNIASASGPSPSPRVATNNREQPEQAQEGESEQNGFLTVNARPEAQVYIDGNLISRRTPLNRHQLPVGSHTVRVFYIEARQFSETRRAVITDGRHISLFFQQRQ